MLSFVQAVISGLLMGGVYAVIAAGLSLIFGVMKIVNFAHGDFLMIFAYTSWILVSKLGFDPYVSMIVVLPAAFAVGYLFQKILINGILKREENVESPNIRLFTVGFAWFLSNLALLLFGADIKTAQTRFKGLTIPLGEYVVSVPRLIAFVVSLAVTAVIFYILYRTETGRALRAISQNRFTAELMGINVKKLYCVAFGLGLSVVGVSACLLVPFYSVFPTMGATFGLRSFVIVVLGGLGSIPGALAGGIAVGLMEAVGGQFVSATSAEIMIFVVFLCALLIRSSSVFSRRRKA